MDLGITILDVQSQKAGDTEPISIVKDGEVSYNKIDGQIKPMWIAALTVSDVEEFLCKKMDISLAYKDSTTTTLTPFTDCKLIGTDFSSLTLRHSVSGSNQVDLKRNSIITHSV